MACLPSNHQPRTKQTVPPSFFSLAVILSRPPASWPPALLATCSLHVPASCSFTFPDSEPRPSATKPVNPPLHPPPLPLPLSRPLQVEVMTAAEGEEKGNVTCPQPPHPRQPRPPRPINLPEPKITSLMFPRGLLDPLPPPPRPQCLPGELRCPAPPRQDPKHQRH